MGDYRIDELAQAAGTTVRNARAYQERGLLPPPRREGRVGIYDETHLSRLQLVGRLLDRGYTLSNISELFSAWEQGRDLGEVLGLEHMLTRFFRREVPEYITSEKLVSILSSSRSDESDDDDWLDKLKARAIEVGLVEVLPGGPGTEKHYRVPSPRVLRAATDLIESGVSANVVVTLGEHLLKAVDEAARRFVDVMSEYVLRDREPGWMPAREEIPALAAFIEHIGPAASNATQAALAQALDRHVDAAFGGYIDRLTPHLRSRPIDSDAVDDRSGDR